MDSCYHWLNFFIEIKMSAPKRDVLWVHGWFQKDQDVSPTPVYVSVNLETGQHVDLENKCRFRYSMSAAGHTYVSGPKHIRLVRLDDPSSQHPHSNHKRQKVHSQFALQRCVMAYSSSSVSSTSASVSLSKSRFTLSGLPVDLLECIADFLSPLDWIEWILSSRLIHDPLKRYLQKKKDKTEFQLSNLDLNTQQVDKDTGLPVRMKKKKKHNDRPTVTELILTADCKGSLLKDDEKNNKRWLYVHRDGLFIARHSTHPLMHVYECEYPLDQNERSHCDVVSLWLQNQLQVALPTNHTQPCTDVQRINDTFVHLYHVFLVEGHLFGVRFIREQLAQHFNNEFMLVFENKTKIYHIIKCVSPLITPCD